MILILFARNVMLYKMKTLLVVVVIVTVDYAINVSLIMIIVVLNAILNGNRKERNQ
jgi:hypothetical protein